MQLTRVTAKAAQHPGTAGKVGETDLLALLLAGDQNAGSGFPAALGAASDGDTPVDPLGDASTKDGAKKKSGDGADVVDAAIAAALALAGVAPGATHVHGAARAAGTAETAGSGGVTATTVIGRGGKAGGHAAGIPVPTIAASSGAATVANAATTAKASPTGTTASDPAAVTEASPAEARPVPSAPAADGAAKSGAETLVATATASATPEAAATSTATHELATRAATHSAAHGHGATPAHGGGADTTRPASFASGAEQEHGLDLGNSEHDEAALAADTIAHAGASSAVTTSATTASDAVHEARPAPGAGATTSGTPPVTAATTATGTPREAAHVDKTLHAAIDATPRWSERVLDAVRLSALRGGGEIRLQLEPEGLGHIDVRLHLESDGVRAVIVAEHESTRALLTGQQHVLQDAFTRSDLKLSGFSVDVGAGSGGAASFARPDDGGRGGAATAAPDAPAPIANGADDDHEGAAAVNGRLSVRV